MGRLNLEVEKGLSGMKSGGQKVLELLYRVCFLIQAWSVGVDLAGW